MANIFGGGGSDSLDGTSGNDSIFAYGGSDTLYGYGGDDGLFGGSGTDTIYAGAGDDEINAGADGDTVYGGDGNDEIIGDAGEDRIYGGDGNDEIDAGDDGDTVYAGDGENTVYGGSGQDDIYAGDGDDEIFSGNDGDHVNAGKGNNTIHGGAGEDELNTGKGDDEVYGGNDKDSLFTGGGDDTLYGGDGEDFLSAGPGSDTLFGGNDNDEFFVRDGGGTVTVADFDAVNETIRIKSATIGDFSDVSARMSDDGTDTTITLDDGSQMIIQNVQVSQLSSSNFVYGSAVCFTPGVLLATPLGARAVETLSVGDEVLTEDAGAKRIRWVGRTQHDWPGTHEKHKPIQIKAGALGEDLPRRDMAVSPQHRLLMAGPIVRRLFGVDEVLAVAKGLTGLKGVRVMKGKREVTYLTLLLDKHQVLIAEGARTESFYPGPTALRMLPSDQRREIQTVFPRLKEDPDTGYGPPARRVLTLTETETLVKAMREQAQEHAIWDEDLHEEQQSTGLKPHLSIVA